MAVPRVFLVAVERSGETLGIDILERCARAGITAQWSGIVGPRLAAAGVKEVADGEVLAVMGLVEVLRHYGALRRLYSQVVRYLNQERPDAVVLVDHPAFNLRVAREAKRLGIRVLYIVGPQIWAWRQHRIHRIREVVDRMFLLFPFERPIYAEAGIPAQVLPHPLLAATAAAAEREAARQALRLPAEGPVLALLPGSRRSEIARLARPMAEAAVRLRQRHPDLCTVVALAREELADQWLECAGPAGAGIVQVAGRSTDVLAAANLVVVASGTATLETALMARPAVVVYAMQALTYRVARWLVRVPFVALPNLLLGRRIYPELLQEEVDPGQIAALLEELLQGEGDSQVKALRSLRALLEGDSEEAVAQGLRQILLGEPAGA